jgi:hypothetical protein
MDDLSPPALHSYLPTSLTNVCPPTMSRYRALDHTVSPCHGHRVAPFQGHRGIGRGRPQGEGAAAGICGRGMACEECVGPFLSHTASVWNITITFKLRHYLKVRIVVFCTPARGTHHALRFEMIWLSQFERRSAPSASAQRRAHADATRRSAGPVASLSWPAQRMHVGRLACILLLVQRSDVRRGCLAPRGRGPLDMAFMSYGFDAMPSQSNHEE